MILGGTDAIADWYERIRAVKGKPGPPFRRLGNFLQLFRVELPKAIYGESTFRVGLLRQNSAFIIPVIEEEEGAAWTVLGEEFRAGAGMRLTGFAAGSNDKEEALRSLAERELEEELGIQADWLEEVSLIPTFAGGDFVSPGGTNEQIALYEARVRLPKGMLVQDLHKKTHGAKGEAEAVTSLVRELTPSLFHELHNTNEKLGLLLLLLARAQNGSARSREGMLNSILAESAKGAHNA
ncbi:MAG: NUDIX domain-containing protein [Verrucomicrobiota bacterium]